MPKVKVNQQEKTLRIGIDLGTSRSAIAAGNGKRKWVQSLVGWPKDFVARKMLGDRVLFGDEVSEHRLSLDVVRPLAHGVIKSGTEKDEESVAELIGHLISLVEPRPRQKIYAAVGVPAEALKVNKRAIREAISDYAEKLIVISEPFAVAYGMGALDNAMIIDMGAGTTDFCIMHGTMPSVDDQRSLTTAGDYIDEQLLGLLTERYPDADLNMNIIRSFKEEHGFVGDVLTEVEVEARVEGRPVVHDITSEMRRACESILPAIAETAMDMIARFDPEYQDQVRNNIILAGGCSQIAGIDTYLAESLSEMGPCKISIVDNPLHAGARGGLALAKDMPYEYWMDM